MEARRKTQEQSTGEIGRALHSLNHTYNICMQLTLGKYGLYPGQPQVLFALKELGRPTQNELAAALGAFIEVRVQLRAINSAKAVQLLLGKLDKLSGGDRQMKLQLLAQSVESSWKGLFPLKGGQAAAPSAAPARVEEEGGTYLL